MVCKSCPTRASLARSLALYICTTACMQGASGAGDVRVSSRALLRGLRLLSGLFLGIPTAQGVQVSGAARRIRIG